MFASALGATPSPDFSPTPVMSRSPGRRRAWRQVHGRYHRGVTLPVPVPTSAQRALRLAGLVMVLAGLFGMHGISGRGSGHGAAGMSMLTAPPALMAASSMSMETSDFAAIPTGLVSDAELLAGNQAEDLLEVATGSGHGGMAMGAMCLAILGAALLALLRLLQRARVAPVVWSRPRPARAIVPRGRDPDPPSLIKLSIQRC